MKPHPYKYRPIDGPFVFSQTFVLNHMVMHHLWLAAVLLALERVPAAELRQKQLKNSSVGLGKVVLSPGKTKIVPSPGKNSSLVNVTEHPVKPKNGSHLSMPNVTASQDRARIQKVIASFRAKGQNARQSAANGLGKTQGTCSYLCFQCLECCDCNANHEGCETWLTNDEGNSEMCSSYCTQCGGGEEKCDNLTVEQDEDEHCPYYGNCCPGQWCPLGYGLCPPRR